MKGGTESAIVCRWLLQKVKQARPINQQFHEMSHLEHGSRGLECDVGDGGDEEEEDPEDDHGEDALRLERLQLLRNKHLDAVRQPRHDVLRRVLRGNE